MGVDNVHLLLNPPGGGVGVRGLPWLTGDFIEETNELDLSHTFETLEERFFNWCAIFQLSPPPLLSLFLSLALSLSLSLSHTHTHTHTHTHMHHTRPNRQRDIVEFLTQIKTSGSFFTPPKMVRVVPDPTPYTLPPLPSVSSPPPLSFTFSFQDDIDVHKADDEWLAEALLAYPPWFAMNMLERAIMDLLIGIAPSHNTHTHAHILPLPSSYQISAIYDGGNRRLLQGLQGCRQGRRDLLQVPECKDVVLHGSGRSGWTPPGPIGGEPGQVFDAHVRHGRQGEALLGLRLRV